VLRAGRAAVARAVRSAAAAAALGGGAAPDLPTIWTGDGRSLFGYPATRTFLASGDWTRVVREGDVASWPEVQYYRAENITEVSGALNITAKNESFGGYAYTSGMIQWTSFLFTFGSLKWRARMPGGTTWPAIWLLGEHCQANNPADANDPACDWPQEGAAEIDCQEHIGQDFTHLNGVTHTASGGEGTAFALGFDASAGVHDYELVRSNNSLIWKVDGITQQTLVSVVPNGPMFLILNIALTNGGPGGTVSPASLPRTMVVEYVSVS
jgi:beta-glucanase (GH16 family)